MGEPVYSLLPVILVSAKDNAAASYIISEIIDNEATDTYKAKEGDIVQDRVWRIVNKYYTADVRLRASGDDQLPGGDEPVDAHIIYLKEDECAVSWCARRCVPGGDVRLVLSARGHCDALAAWAARQHYELVPLAPEPEPEPEPALGADDCGVRRARAALHAHAWRGLQRRAAPRSATLLAASPDSESESSRASSDSASDPERDVERAELFAAALGALPAAAGRARGAGAGDAEPRALRLARAEALLHDFCHALGLQLDDC